MTITKEYRIACVEVLEVLKGLNDEELGRIPTERINIYEKYKDCEYKFKLDANRDFNEQISNVAQAIIANLFVRFIATPEDRNNIYIKEKQEFINSEIEKQKNIKLNPLFEEKNKIKNKNEQNALVVVKKKSFLQNIFEQVKKIFKWS